MKYTQVPVNTFKELQLNAGIICSSFAPATGEVTGLIGATTGGINFTATPTFNDFGEDIDNIPNNMMELKQLEQYEVTMSGTLLTMTTTTAKALIAAADVSGDKVTPRADLAAADFSDIWFVGDYSDKHGATKAGFIAIHMLNALSTGGFQLQTGDREKGRFDFEYTAHYSLDAQDTVPFEVYIHAGENEPA